MNCLKSAPKRVQSFWHLWNDSQSFYDSGMIRDADFVFRRGQSRPSLGTKIVCVSSSSLSGGIFPE
jgi:hypothetical protein